MKSPIKRLFKITTMLFLIAIMSSCQGDTIQDDNLGEDNRMEELPLVSSPTPSSSLELDRNKSELISAGSLVPFDMRQGTFLFPTRYSDAGLASLYPGRTISIGWTTPPQGANLYEVYFVFFEELDPILIGSDDNDIDGIYVEWLVPASIGGQFLGIAYYSNDQVIYSGWTHDVYSGELPPDGVCSASASNMGSLQILQSPDSESEHFAELIPGDYAIVLGRTDNGWFRLDANNAYYSFPDVLAEGTGWIHHEQNVEFFGECTDLLMKQD